MENSKVLILGSNSFAGSCFVDKALDLGCQVLGVSRSDESLPFFKPSNIKTDLGKYRFVKADLNNDLEQIILLLREFAPEWIIDFAGQGMVADSWVHPEQWYQTNIVSKVRLHQELLSHSELKKYIRVSTPEVYGSNENLINESWLLNPTTPYAVSHAAIDLSLKAFYKQYQFPVVFTRFANFYGPRQQLYRIVPRTIIYALTGQTLQLHGGGTSMRAFIYGEDVAEAIHRTIIGGAPGEIYHFSPQEFYSIKQIVEKICDKLAVDIDQTVRVVPDRAGKDLAYLMDSSRARAELGWTPSTTLDVGLEKVIDWVKEYLPEILSAPQDYIHKR